MINVTRSEASKAREAEQLNRAHRDAVEVELKRRLDEGFSWMGYTIQIDDASQTRMSAQVLQAKIWLDAGGAGGSLRWADADRDMAWIDIDNQPVPVTADDMIALGIAGAAYVRAMRFAANALKADQTVDFIDDASWPAP